MRKVLCSQLMKRKRKISDSLIDLVGRKTIRKKIVSFLLKLLIVLGQVTVKEATVNTLVAVEVLGWFFIGK
jgi:hypothetical protein